MEPEKSSAGHQNVSAVGTKHRSHLDSTAVEDLRRKLKYFFMSPCEKFKARQQKPWKLIIQILKICAITFQLISFGLSNQMMVTFKVENLLTFRHLFLKGYSDKNLDTYAVYSNNEVYDHIYFLVDKYVNLQNLIVGNLAYKRNERGCTPLSICQDFYKNNSILPGSESFYLDPQIQTECINIYPLQSLLNPKLLRNQLNFTLDFQRLVSINIQLALKAINVQTVQHHELPDCYDFTITITFKNRAHSGKIKMILNSNFDIKECKDWKVTGPSARNLHFHLFFDVFIIIACFMSLILCTRSVVRGMQLQFEFTAFVQTYHKKAAHWSDRMEFVSGWYIFFIVTDVLAVVGSGLKIAIQTKNFTNYDICSILLGTATMLVWVGVIRYFGFYQKYNILIVTLRAAFPSAVRFCCCAIMIYLGYTFCGWIVLGPYHLKFQTLNSVAECLFSIINGEIFHTFRSIQSSSYLVWLFSRIYLYSFALLFVYMVLSLFIALITDTYQKVKQHQEDCLVKSELWAFIAECRDLPASEKFTTDEQPASSAIAFSVSCSPANL
ncbi:mucolipin-3-like [Arapaima gigas]